MPNRTRRRYGVGSEAQCYRTIAVLGTRSFISACADKLVYTVPFNIRLIIEVPRLTVHIIYFCINVSVFIVAGKSTEASGSFKTAQDSCKFFDTGNRFITNPAVHVSF